MIIAFLVLAAGTPPLSADQAEGLAARSGPTEAGRLWATAGNLRLTGGDPVGASRDFDRALASSAMSPSERGEVLLDRARAAQAAGDLATATARAAEAARLIPQDPFLWYLRTSLALAAGDVPQAKIAIARALALTPDSAPLLFESGHVAQLAGEDAVARAAWTRALALDPNGPTGRAAGNALALAGAPLTVQSTSQP